MTLGKKAWCGRRSMQSWEKLRKSSKGPSVSSTKSPPTQVFTPKGDPAWLMTVITSRTFAEVELRIHEHRLAMRSPSMLLLTKDPHELGKQTQNVMSGLSKNRR